MTSKRIAITGFMGVGKTSVARHLSSILKCRRIDLDALIEKNEGRKVGDIIKEDGEPAYRKIETQNLKKLLLENNAKVISLGGGTFTIEENRKMLKEHDIVGVWLEASFDHCWLHIKASQKERPLAKDKQKAQELFETRQTHYCLADWHFVIRPGYNSYEIAKQIADEIFS